MTLAPILGASPAIQLHLAATLAALGLGIAIFLKRKGTAGHKALGRSYVAAMVTAAGSSFWITEINDGRFSLIHLLSVITFVTLAYAVWQVRRGNVTAHKSAMVALFVGGLGIAGFFTLVPGRLLGQALFGWGA